MSILNVEKIEIANGRMKVDVQVSPGVSHHINESTAMWALKLCPTLAAHACVNKAGPTFMAVIGCASVPHLFEHLIIDEQVRSESTLTEQSFVGSTEWLNEPDGKAHIEVNFFDDLVALRALKNALALLDSIMAPQTQDPR